MRIGIHRHDGSFSDRWIEYCKEKSVDFKIVNCYDNNIIEQLKDCDGLMWHYYQTDYRDMLFAKQLLFSLEQSGKIVFPNFSTGWHFDDKVGQKYLFETLGIKLVPTYIFYSRKEALAWVSNTNFPKVFKLRGGAASENVKLAHSKREAIRFINKSFGKGFSQFDRIGYLKERIRKVIEGKDPFIGILKGLCRLLISTEFAKMHGREKGYVYFQEFLPNNNFDIRVTLVGDKAFAAKRLNRKNDFRASGSGNVLWDKSEIDERCVQTAFEINNKLKSQSLAIDFIFDYDNNPLITEISYGWPTYDLDKCPGYWDSNLNWKEGKFNPQYWQVENLISALSKRVDNCQE
jgi:glutathione synthase/RimK-type ligase-like ATP-grasp enzyme